MLMLLMASFGFLKAADLPLDFESGTYEFTNFDGGTVTIIDNPHATGINTSAKVAQMVKNAGAAWGGSYITLDNAIDFSTNNTFKMKVYSPRVGAKVLLKVENADNGAINFEKEVLTSVANEWEELSFDYSAINKSESYHKIVLIFDNGTMGDGSADFTFLFDDIMLAYEEVVVAAPQEAAPAPPARAEGDVIAVFSGAYTELAETNFNPNWGQSTVVTTELVSGDATLKYANLNYQGTEFASPIDASEMEYIHIDMWTSDASAVNFSPISTGAEKAYALSVESEAWVSYDIPLTAFNDVVNLADIIQIKFDGTTGSTIYLDNIYFYKGEALLAPSLPLDFEADNVDYSFNNFDGGEVTVIDNPESSGINTSSKVAQMVKNAGQVWGGSYLSLGTPIDFSVDKTVRMKVFVPNAGDKVTFKVENSADGGIALEKEATTTVGNEWEWLVYDFSEIDDNDYDKVVIIFENGTMGDGSADFTYYFDDIEVVTLSDDASLSDLQVDGTTVEGFDAATLDYTMELPQGTTAVPAVTATVTDDGASVVVTDATELPGTTTIVVTAEDQVTTTTYTVEFTLATTVSDALNEQVRMHAHAGMLYIDLEQALVNGQVEVFDISGRRILSRAVNGTREALTINTGGVLLVKITDAFNQRVITGKVLAR